MLSVIPGIATHLPRPFQHQVFAASFSPSAEKTGEKTGQTLKDPHEPLGLLMTITALTGVALQFATSRHSGECRNPVDNLFIIVRKYCLLDSGIRRNDGPYQGSERINRS